MKKSTFICLILTSFFACQEAPKNTSTTTPTDKTAEVPSDKGGAQNDADLIAITDVVHNFYKWYPTTVDNLDYVDSKGKTSKLDNTKLAAYHAKLMKSGFISQTYIDNDVAYLKKYEAEWTKNKENNNDEPLSGLDYDRVFCGQDWEPKDYTTGTLKVDGLGTNQAKTTVGASHLELIKENGKWLISKITCE